MQHLDLKGIAEAVAETEKYLKRRYDPSKDTLIIGRINPKPNVSIKRNGKFKNSTYLDQYDLDYGVKNIRGKPMYIDHNYEIDGKQLPPCGVWLAGVNDPKKGAFAVGLLDRSEMGDLAKRLLGADGNISSENAMQELSIGYIVMDSETGNGNRLPVASIPFEVSITYKGVQPGTEIKKIMTVQEAIEMANKASVNKVQNGYTNQTSAPQSQTLLKPKKMDAPFDESAVGTGNTVADPNAMSLDQTLMRALGSMVSQSSQPNVVTATASVAAPAVEKPAAAPEPGTGLQQVMDALSKLQSIVQKTGSAAEAPKDESLPAVEFDIVQSGRTFDKPASRRPPPNTEGMSEEQKKEAIERHNELVAYDLARAEAEMKQLEKKREENQQKLAPAVPIWLKALKSEGGDPKELLKNFERQMATLSTSGNPVDQAMAEVILASASKTTELHTQQRKDAAQIEEEFKKNQSLVQIANGLKEQLEAANRQLKETQVENEKLRQVVPLGALTKGGNTAANPNPANANQANPNPATNEPAVVGNAPFGTQFPIQHAASREIHYTNSAPSAPVNIQEMDPAAKVWAASAAGSIGDLVQPQYIVAKASQFAQMYNAYTKDFNEDIAFGTGARSYFLNDSALEAYKEHVEATRGPKRMRR